MPPAISCCWGSQCEFSSLFRRWTSRSIVWRRVGTCKSQGRFAGLINDGLRSYKVCRVSTFLGNPVHPTMLSTAFVVLTLASMRGVLCQLGLPRIFSEITALEQSNSSLLQYPTDLTRNIVPKQIHSHNDCAYTTVQLWIVYLSSDLQTGGTYLFWVPLV